MTEERVKRRLAAIVAADMVGWSRLMGADEVGTLAALKRHREELIDPKIAEYDGRIVKSTGDGLLVEFPSAVDAVHCSVEIQESMAERNAHVPADNAMRFRVGINVGDVIIDGDDVFGDGVNVAARLEALAEPGGLSISGNVYEQIAGKLPFAFADGGMRTVKNIAQPIHIWTWPAPSNSRKSANAPTAAVDVTQPVAGFNERPAIAVLPFSNMSGDPEQEYFADGITEDIITGLSLWRWFPVIARNSTFTYKGRSVDVKQIGRELGVRYVLEGSVRKIGNRVRVTAQLNDTASGAHVWAERYDRELTDIFALQDEITGQIIAQVAPEISFAEAERAARSQPANLDTWDLLQRGIWHHNQYTKEDNIEARVLFARAMAADSKFAMAPGWLAVTHLMDVYLGWSENPSESVSECLRLARSAVALDAQESLAHAGFAAALVLARQAERAVEEGSKAIVLNPSLATGHFCYGTALFYAGRPAKGIEELRIALRLSPRDPNTSFNWAIQSLAYLMSRDFAAAIECARSALQTDPNNARALHRLASALGHNGDIDKARNALEEADRIMPRPSREYFEMTYPFADPHDLEFFLEGLRKAGWNG